jgi:hypothetical protein
MQKYIDKKVYCTLGWDARPVTTIGKDGGVLPRRVEMIINEKYYPTGEIGEWPIDPDTGKKLEILKL